MFPEWMVRFQREMTADLYKCYEAALSTAIGAA